MDLMIFIIYFISTITTVGSWSHNMWVYIIYYIARSPEKGSHMGSKLLYYWVFNHCEYIPATLRHDIKIYTRGRNVEKSRSQSEIQCTTIIFRVHIDSIYDIVPSNTCSVGNEQQFVKLTTVGHDIYLQSSD